MSQQARTSWGRARLVSGDNYVELVNCLHSNVKLWSLQSLVRYMYKAPNLWPHLRALRSRVISSRSQHKLCELWQSPGDRSRDLPLSPSLSFSLFLSRSFTLFRPLSLSFYLSLLSRGYGPQSSCGFVLNWTSKSLWDRSKKTCVCNLYFCLSTMSGRRVAFSDITASSILSRGGDEGQPTEHDIACCRERHWLCLACSWLERGKTVQKIVE